MPQLLKGRVATSLLLITLSVGMCLTLWWVGRDLLAPLGDWAAQEQRAFQNRIAGALRALRGGQAGALSLLLLVCFAYGFFHAIGPGHGKVLIGGYGLGRKVPWMRLSLVALLSSLGQAVTAVVLVYAAILVLQLGRDSMIGIAEKTMAPISYAAIAGIGIWLLLRGARKLFRTSAAAKAEEHHSHEPHSHEPHSQEPHSHEPHSHDHHSHHHDGHHHHSHDHSAEAGAGAETCADCGHRHGPSLEEVEHLSSWREAAILIAGIAVRPCTGALFVLIITWQMGIALAGVAGAFAMALGTASVTIAVGLAALGLRGGALSLFAANTRARQVVPLLEITAGLLIALVAAGLMLTSLR
ncbi:hypothetical protein [Pseudophaeobacter sp.]|uniref:nickel/cobalt transporter n=1 Tax=Pseudophaeobacter sp. TaxID=1971739 RepID=UPI003297AE05